MYILLNIFFVIAIFILIRPGSMRQTVKMMLAATSILAAILCISKMPELLTPHYAVEVTACNEKNSLSEGFEIWLNKVIINGAPHAPSEFFSSGWIEKDGAYFWRTYDRPQGMTDSIHAIFSKQDSVQLLFQKNKWRGKAIVKNNEQSEIIDFYEDTTDKNEVYTYDIPISSKKVSSQAVYLSALTIIFALTILYEGCFSFFTKEQGDIVGTHPIKERSVWIDCLKIASAFMIVVIHASGECFNQSELLTSSWWKMLWINIIPRFAVPCFLMITGILYMNRKDTFRYAFNKARQIAIIVFIWSCIYILTHKFIWGDSQDILTEILKVPFNHVASPLWYGYELIWIFLTLPFWQILYQKVASKEKMYFIGICLFLPAGLDFAGRMLALGNGGYAPFGTHVFYINYIGIMFLGAFLYERILKCKKLFLFVTGIFISTVGVLLMVYGTYHLTVLAGKNVHDLFGETRLPALLYAIGILILFYSLTEVLSSLPTSVKIGVERLSKVSLGIYFSHLLAIWCFPDITMNTFYISKTSGPAGVLLMVCIYFTLSACSALLLSNLPYLKRMVS